MKKHADLLPKGCAQLMVVQAEMLRATIAEYMQAA
jgi:hypothetical protein